MDFFDTHTHTFHSHDSQCPLNELCESAAAHGLKGISVTDHCDLEQPDKTAVFNNTKASFEDAQRAKERWRGRLFVGAGVELGEALFSPGDAFKILSSFSFDVVLGSVHAVRVPGREEAYSRMDFSVLSDVEIDRYLEQYFRDVEEMITTFPIHVLAHLTCPFSYLVGFYGRNADPARYSLPIDRILKEIIARGIALEVNTSRVNAPYGKLMPDEEILRRFRALGGERVTLASDCHIAKNTGVCFQETAGLLLSIGFSAIYHFEQEQPIAEKIN
jgi:histidinol-phosphatase (PHP family)